MNSEIEFAIAAEAACFAQATAELNPYAEAEVLELGNARAVYCGVLSPVHGVFGLGLDGPVEERDFQEIERFFERKERAPNFWVTPFTDPSLLEFLGKYQVAKTQVISGALAESVSASDAAGDSAPDLSEWRKAFTLRESAFAAEIRLHQKNTRFYLGENSASFTFFHQGVALLPSDSALCPKQFSEAKKFQCKIIAVMGESQLPTIYERKIYERIQP